jgi:hypothetical protein
LPIHRGKSSEIPKILEPCRFIVSKLGAVLFAVPANILTEADFSKVWGGRAPLGGNLAVLADLAAEQNDATLAEYAERFAARTGTRRSVAAICLSYEVSCRRAKRNRGRGWHPSPSGEGGIDDLLAV